LSGVIQDRDPPKKCNRPGGRHPERLALYHLKVQSRKVGDWGIDCYLCGPCARDFKKQFVSMVTYGLAVLEPL